MDYVAMVRANAKGNNNMTKQKWIEYMLHIIQPKPGLERSCREMLSNMYDIAYRAGEKHQDLD